MMLGQGIAVFGIWMAVAAIGYKEPFAGFITSFFAFLATFAVFSC